MMILIFTGLVNANPVLNNVVSGNISIQQSPDITQVNQRSQDAIINWQSFNIGAKQATHFIQPPDGIALNRINSAYGASQIFGTLTATGKLVLINSAGIYFGPGAMVDVGGIIASTSDMSDKNFLTHHYVFDQPSTSRGSIVNRGTIVAEHGLVALVGTGVSNEGFIQANLGQVVLASGSKFTVDLSGDELINFSIDGAATSAGKSPVDGSSLKNGVNNSGMVIANGGKILMSAQVAENIVDHAINMSGVAQAHSVYQRNGQIILSGGNYGTVRVTGRLDASGRAHHQHGGTVKVLGKYVDVESPAVIDASGDIGGGQIYIGGNFHGAGPDPNAVSTTIGAGSIINADALTYGNGGNIAVWSDNVTNYAGSISAKGGALGGNGGFAEVSGHQLLNFTGAADLSAAKGMTGTLLLDPENLTIEDSNNVPGATTTASLSGNTYTSNADDSVLTVGDLQNLLATNNVLVKTGSSGTQAGDITIAANTAISWSTANSLTLSAYHDVIFGTGSSISNSAGASLTIRADNTGTGSGTITFPDSSTYVTMSGGTGVVNFYYNPSSYTTPTDFSSNVSVSSGGQFNAWMLVNTVTNLQNIASTGQYALGTNIDASATSSWNNGSGFIPISEFKGQFDGLNHTISNLTIANSSSNTGLFGLVDDSAASISNVILSNPNITGTDTTPGVATGALIGEMTDGSVSNVAVIGGTVNGQSYVGGVIGSVQGLNSAISISQASSSATVNGIAPSFSQYIGGVIGSAVGNVAISNAYSTGDVNVSSSSSTAVGGLIGYADGISIQKSFSAGIVNAQNSAADVGGFIGEMDLNYSGVSITDSYSTSTVFGNLNVGGFIGLSNGTNTLTNTYSIGDVNGVINVGGFIGALDTGLNPPTITITNSFWNTDTAAHTGGIDAMGNPDNPAGFP
ncbi:MAG: two-partner secretion domain-containing protein, partial [Gammaproteobacteria bacterium]